VKELPKILAVASGGGHWAQLRRLRPAFEGCRVVWVTTDAGYRADVAPSRFYAVRDASRWNKPALAWSAVQMLAVLLRERPDVVISTGAAPGFLAVWLGKRLGARTVWIDSMANVEEMSLSGQMASRHADVCLTQWPHLAGGRVRCEGAVL
jgi:UDP-N-acetylglucosamine:LPS N-acetylglucosamine transferase